MPRSALRIVLFITFSAVLSASGGGESKSAPKGEAPKPSPESSSSGSSRSSSSESKGGGVYTPPKRTPAEEAEYERLKPQFEFYFRKEVGPPRVIENKGILFTFSERDERSRAPSADPHAKAAHGDAHMPAPKLRKPAEKIVEVSGDFMNWEGAVPLIKGKEGVYYYLHEQPFNKERYTLRKGRYFYRFRVNGVWMNDPLATNVAYDNAGQKVSFFFVPRDVVFYRSNPLYHDDKTVTFFVSNTSAREVYFTTDRHDFDPRRFRMQFADGVWTITFDEDDMPDGGYYYNFLIDGQWTLDPKSRNTFEDRQARKHSFVLVRRIFRLNE